MRAIIAFIGLLLFAPVSYAHRLDELLQAALIRIEPDTITIHLNLTPGVEIYDQLIQQLDRNRNGEISTREAKAYTEQICSDLTLQLDQRPLKLKIKDRYCPTASELRTGLGTIHLEMTAFIRTMSPGAHELAFYNKHQTNLSVYLANVVLSSSPQIDVQKQLRNKDQSELRVEFTRSDNIAEKNRR